MADLTQEKKCIVRRVSALGVIWDEIVPAKEAIPLAKDHIIKGKRSTRFEVLDVGNSRRRPAVIWHSGLMGEYAKRSRWLT